MRSVLSTLFALLLLSALGSPGAALATQEPACTAPVADQIEAVRTKGSREAYLCLAIDPGAGPALLKRIEGEEFDEVSGSERIRRALAIHLIHQLDRPLTGDEVRALSAPDRRLLRDAVYARRGRKSPSPEHDAVFQQFSWYAPSPSYTNGALSEGDRANLDLIDDPPKPPEPDAPPSAAEAVAETAGAAPAAQASGCGCAGAPTAPLAGLALVGLVGGLSRRRDRGFACRSTHA